MHFLKKISALRFGLGFFIAVGASAAVSIAAEPPAKPMPPKTDVAAIRDKLVVLSDGKNHYLAVVPTGQGDGMFYGDGKRFFEMRGVTAGKNGENWERGFIDPRFTEGGHEEGMGFIAFRDGAYKVDCGPRTTALKPLDAKAAQALLTAATFERSPRGHRPYALARDESGVYYYVDRGYHEDESKKFRLFVGPKGNLKQQKMTNIVSDPQGDIFSTKTGSLRLILDKGEAGKRESTWIKNNKKSKLTVVPVDFNASVAPIYNEFGVYAGERLGTPCDDL